MTRPYIIGVGLPADHPLVPAKFQTVVRQAIAQSNTVFEAAGYDMSQCLIGPEAGVEPLVDRIKKRAPDGVLIGWGLRSIKPVTPFFEAVINAVRVHAPECKLAFNTGPDSEESLAAIKRWVPIQG